MSAWSDSVVVVEAGGRPALLAAGSCCAEVVGCGRLPLLVSILPKESHGIGSRRVEKDRAALPLCNNSRRATVKWAREKVGCDYAYPQIQRNSAADKASEIRR